MWPFKSKKIESSELDVAVKEVEVSNPQIGDWTKKIVSKFQPKGDGDLEALKKALGNFDMRLAEAKIGVLPIEKASIHSSRELIVRRHFDRVYNKLDLGILGWRKKQEGFDVPLPVFGIFDPFNTDNTCVIKTNKHFGSFGKSDNDVVVAGRRCRELVRFYNDICTGDDYEAAFSGFIPRNIAIELKRLDEIRNPKKNTFSFSSEPNIFGLGLIAECDWKLKLTPPDPLVVAAIGTDAWLIASFDTTAIERIAVSEFTS